MSIYWKAINAALWLTKRWTGWLRKMKPLAVQQLSSSWTFSSKTAFFTTVRKYTKPELECLFPSSYRAYLTDCTVLIFAVSDTAIFKDQSLLFRFRQDDSTFPLTQGTVLYVYIRQRGKFSPVVPWFLTLFRVCVCVCICVFCSYTAVLLWTTLIRQTTLRTWIVFK